MAEADPPYVTLGLFLTSDVQSNPRFCTEILDAISQVQAGVIQEWCIAGNAHRLDLDPSGAVITMTLDDVQGPGPCYVTLYDLQQAVHSWLRFVSPQ